MGLHARECWFYSQWHHRVVLRSPRFFGMGSEPSAPLLVEDLGALRAGDQVSGLALTDAERLMDVLAYQHAQFWRSPDCDDPRLATATDEAYAGMVSHLVNSGVENMVTRFADRAPADALDAVVALAPRWLDVIVACGQGPATVAHNDCRLDNIFFDDTGDPIFIDWQAIGVTRGTHDVANLLAGSMETILLSQYWESLVQRYHDQLCAAGVGDYSWDQCLEHYRQSALFPLGQGIALVGAPDRHDGRGLTDPALLRPLQHCFEIASFDTI